VSEPALELVGIDKHFGTNHANKSVSFRVRRGEVLGLIGENGAGKSTVMNMVFGYLTADSGQILVNGHEVDIKVPADAIAHGIGMVHQHFKLVDTFSVLENIVLGSEGGFQLGQTLAAARSELIGLSRAFGLNVDPDALISTLSVGDKQKVEILKALYRKAEILILDEPTAVLTPDETKHLFTILRQWREQGRTVILITHKLKEVLAVTDRVIVMRRGAVVAELNTSDCTAEGLAEHMVGRPVILKVSRTPASPGRPIIEIDNLSVRDSDGIYRLKNINLSLRAGEITGLAGVSGNGQSELIEAIAGLQMVAQGHIRFNGTDLGAGGSADAVRKRRDMGIAHVPEDRLVRGLIEQLSAKDNAILGRQNDQNFNRRSFLNKDAILNHCRALMTSFDVRPARPLQAGGHFSGGNQQKIVLGREMENCPAFLIVGQPTRGVDIGAIEFIHQRIVALRDQGAAILLVSAELDEILMLSDRVLVMSQGVITGDVTATEADERQIGLWMAGGHQAAA
jgi:simple sugar transport system ATP-binding protein